MISESGIRKGYRNGIRKDIRNGIVWGLSQKWEGGLVIEKLVYGSMERAAEIAKTIPLAKKVLGCKIGA